ncbi:MAG TPA: hypothetical protein VFE17_05595 [Candidatus Baltobacteraceae bacterium]|jgi:hypothetical protein|nr:hypothetical protein [Candidatus Baltobacteraceae bacterium]
MRGFIRNVIAAACECYETISRSWEADMGYPLQKTTQGAPADRSGAGDEMLA